MPVRSLLSYNGMVRRSRLLIAAELYSGNDAGWHET